MKPRQSMTSRYPAAHRVRPSAPLAAAGRHPHGPSFRSAPQVGHSPAQSGRQIGVSGRFSNTASRASGSRSRVSLASG